MTVGEKKVIYTASRSCMYVRGMRAGQNDWIQLGWLIAWVKTAQTIMAEHLKTF